jgi:sterol desaturase/sphingolipid hydroxylase (fatty acid hydroxylase superfamily)
MWQLFRRLLSVPVALGFSVHALFRFGWSDLGWWALYVVAGIWLWTLFEYAMHRWLYHRVVFFKRYHDTHHVTPDVYIGAPPIIGTGLIVLVTMAPLASAAPLAASGMTVGMLVGYAAYMIVHHVCHFATPAHGSYLYRARLRHAVHHYSHDEHNFGVSTAFWDRVFRTHRMGQRRFVDRHAAPGPANQGIASNHQP